MGDESLSAYNLSPEIYSYYPAFTHIVGNLANPGLTLEISHGQKSVPVTPEGHEDLPRDINLNSKSRFKLKSVFPDMAAFLKQY